jgi:hypothetical protein
MCNAHNHSSDCPCGFGGDTGGGGGPRAVTLARWYAEEVLERPVSVGWAKDSRGTVEGYVNPNAHCPVCGKLVYFYRSPYDGRVFFDELGWPWPKHGCTDNGREPRRVAHDAPEAKAPRLVSQWRLEGWRPLLSARAHASADSQCVTGDFGDVFLELRVARAEKIDINGPLLMRAVRPYLFEMTFLHSTPRGVQEAGTFAFDPKIASVGEDVIAEAAQCDPAASYAVGAFILWELDDPVNARPYLEIAGEAGMLDALIDLAVLELLSA